MTIALSRFSPTSTTAVNAARTLPVLGANTAAGNIVVPPGMTHCLGVIPAAGSDFTTVGADVWVLEAQFTLAGTQWFLAGAGGGQNATGENSNCLPGDLVPTNIPVSASESFNTNGYSEITDTGAQVFGVTYIFGVGDSSKRTWHDVRVGQPSALDTPVALNIRGTSTAAGDIQVLASYRRIYGMSVCGASTSGVVGQAIGSILMVGSGLEGGSQQIVSCVVGGTLNTSSGMIVATKFYPVDSKVVGPSTISVQASLGAVDIGALSQGIGLHFEAALQ